mmetsp:Transcript_60143/g.111531  ORF Transcript_60143/g.111531 Transcript_60143/m.111531 type:complete len:268 (-) Transcript_60143:81-884(-)
MPWPWHSQARRFDGGWSDQRSIRFILRHSRHNLAAFSVLISCCSTAYMFVITLAVVATGGVRQEHVVMVGCLVSAHHMAQASALLRMVCMSMNADEEGLDAWWCSTAVAAFVVDITQGTFLILTWRPHWIYWVLTVSLSFILLLDASEVYSAHGLQARRRARFSAARAEASQKPKAVAPDVQTFTFARADVEKAVGKAVSENPCHICLDELQDGELVGKLACGHCFHAQCIARWLKTGSGCPLRCASGQFTTEAGEAVPMEAEVSTV